MDQQFKKILQKTKAVLNGQDPIVHTYEGALFKDSGWVFGFDESISTQDVGSVEVGVAFEPVAAAIPITPSLITNKSLVMFVGDSFKEGTEDLLGKMIQAMKLESHEYTRHLFDEKLEDVLNLESNNEKPSIETEVLLKAIVDLKPKVVVSLGATVTNILLGRREKLSGIHGQFFDKSIVMDHEEYQYQLFPIFHPDFLLINPNMKRTAWIDLQKVMECVGKI